MKINLANNVQIQRNDITCLEVDAIVNAANSALTGGGGVDGAIHRAAGSELTNYCRTLGGCKTGFAKITPGFNLPCKYVIHTVGPVWYGGHKNEEQLLASCYKESLTVAKLHNIKSIAFPAISCGAYRFPLRRACQITIKEVSSFLQDTNYNLTVYFAYFDQKAANELTRQLKQSIESQ